MPPSWFKHALPVLAALVLAPAAAQEQRVLTGEVAFGGWQSDAPGVRRLIRPQDMPAPYTTPSASERATVVAMPDGVKPIVPEGFTVELLASGLITPRTIRIAPNGDIFVAESGAGRLLVFRRGEDGTVEKRVFADGFDYPYGIAFYPAGPSPVWLYIAQTTRIVRFPYAAGDLKASKRAEPVLAGIPGAGHATRDILFTPDNKTMLLAIGSRSNAGEGMGQISPENLASIEQNLGLGSAWGDEIGRASVMSFDPSGKNGKLYAAGVRNCAGATIQPATGDLWCATNERDGLGDNLPPDYVSRIKPGAFYGWPWYYIGDNEDPRHAGERPDLKGKITVPDVLLQPHSAPLSIVFYDGESFPAEYRGDGFAALHGSWNRGGLTGYKVVRIVTHDGVPTGEYEDFMTGFVRDDRSVWGRPVGVAVAKDGALLVSEDANGTIWRVQAAR